MLIVADDRAVVETDLAAGRLLCPRCGVGVLGGWGCARLRVVRTRAGVRRLRPRRARCRGCGGTHVLLPDMAFSRRRDEVSVIGAAIGEGRRRGTSADRGRLGVHADTVRGWLRRFDSALRIGRISAVGGRAGRLVGSAGRRRVVDALEAIAVPGGRGCCGAGHGRGYRRLLPGGCCDQHETAFGVCVSDRIAAFVKESGGRHEWTEPGDRVVPVGGGPRGDGGVAVGAERGGLVRALAEREHLGPDGRGSVSRAGRLIAGSASTVRAGSRRWSRHRGSAGGDAGAAAGAGVRAPARAAGADGGAGQRIMLQAAGRSPCADDQYASRGRGVDGGGAADRAGAWPVRGFGPQRAVDGGRVARPAGRRPPRGAVLLHRRSLPPAGRVAVGHRRGRVPRWRPRCARVMARGFPKAVLVDRGSPFVSSQLLRACAVLGVRLIHASPRGRHGGARSSGSSEPSAINSWSRSMTAYRARRAQPAFPHGWRSSITDECTPRPGRRRSRGSTPPARRAADRGAARSVLVVRADRDEDRDGVAARQQIRGRRRAGGPQGRAGVRPVRPGRDRGRIPAPRFGLAVPLGSAGTRIRRPSASAQRRQADRDRLPRR